MTTMTESAPPPAKRATRGRKTQPTSASVPRGSGKQQTAVSVPADDPALPPTGGEEEAERRVVQRGSRATQVLPLALRPRALDELVGQEHIAHALSRQFASARIPHLFILGGPVGSGKTTLARIIGRMIHEAAGTNASASAAAYALHEINAANKTGVDDARALIDVMTYRPMPPAKAKVVILDEAHQLSAAAQNALLTATEDAPAHAYYVFCTSAPSKIIAALRRRAYVITPRPLTTPDALTRLVQRAAEAYGYQDDAQCSSPKTDDLIAALREMDVTSPGLVVQAAERFFGGLDALHAITASMPDGIAYEMASTHIDTLSACRAVADGNWSKCAAVVKDAVKNDAYGLRACVLGYLKSIMLRAPPARAAALAKGIRALSEVSLDEGALLPSVMAGMCQACAFVNTSNSSQ